MYTRVDQNTIRLQDGHCVRTPFPIDAIDSVGNLVLLRSFNPRDQLETVTGTYSEQANIVLFVQTRPGVILTIDAGRMQLTLPNDTVVHFERPIRQIAQYDDDFFILVVPGDDPPFPSNARLINSQGSIVWTADAIDGGPIPAEYAWIGVTRGGLRVFNGALAAEIDETTGKVLKIFTEK